MRLVLDHPARRAAAVDAVAIVVFAVLGLLSHEHGVSGRGLARDALPLLAGWFGASLLTSVYRRPTLWRLALTWAIGVVAGVLVRAGILGRELGGGQAAFLVTSLLVTAALVVAGRLALAASCPAYRGCERLRVLSGPPLRLWVFRDSRSKEGADVSAR